MSAFGIHSVPTNLLGPGALSLLPDVVRQHGFRRALIVTDDFLYRSGVAAKVALQLEAGGVQFGMFAKVEPNPTIAVVNECRDYALGIGADCLVAVGGGSPIDTAKAAGILLTNGGTVEQYEGVNKSHKPSLPILVVNTTAGTGSEVTSFYIVTNPAIQSKLCMADINCIPIAAINDSDLMLSMPPGLTAATGLDALTHAVEAYLAVGANPITDKDALWAVEMIATYLPRAVADGSDSEARAYMAYAANAAGMAFSNSGLGIVHAMAHALGGFYNLPHGVCNAVLLPYALAFNSTCPQVQKRMTTIARAVGVVRAEAMSPSQAAKLCIRQIAALSASLGIPAQLSEMQGVSPQDFDSLATLAMADACMAQNPVSPTQEQVVALYDAAYHGRR